jgi:hypothetical protein
MYEQAHLLILAGGESLPLMLYKGDQMKIIEVLQLDCREQDEAEKLDKCLKSIKPFSYCESKVSIENLEKLIHIISNKYDVFVRSISPDAKANKNFIIWRSSILSSKDLSIVQNVYGHNLYECLAKTAIYMYFSTRKVDK